MAARKSTNTGTKSGSKSETKRSTTRSRAAKSSTAQSATSKSTTTPRTAGRQVELTEIPPSLASQIWKLLRTTVFGRILLAGMGFAIMVLLTILFSGNRFDRFAVVLGIEVILIAIITWVVYLYRNRDDFFNQTEN